MQKTTEMVENILELAYIKDPKLFDRDAETRRSKTRQDLKAETGQSKVKFYVEILRY
jgi:activating signal cointegrator complex subunit 2